MSFHGLGVTEHYQGTFTVMQIADIAMMTGNIGRRGVGVNPLRGQNNVQGAADMGCQPHQGAGYFAVDEPANIKPVRRLLRRGVPHVVGKKIPQMYDAMLDGTLKAMWVCRRGHGPDGSQHQPRAQGPRRARPLRGAGALHDGDRQARARRACPAPASWRRAAPSPTASAASNA
jgi:formate dehydrogenase major subunit